MLTKVFAVFIYAITAYNSELNCSFVSSTLDDVIPSKLRSHSIPFSSALDSSGYPVISYYDGSDKNLKIARCHDKRCYLYNLTVIYEPGVPIAYQSLALDEHDKPVISFNTDTRYLGLTRCYDKNCLNLSPLIWVDNNRNVGAYVSLALDSDSYPVMAYEDNTYDYLKLARCNDQICSDVTLTILDPTVVLYISLALDRNNYPVISYFDDISNYLKLARCYDKFCSSVDFVMIDVYGKYCSLALDNDDNAVISYFGQANSNLKLARCHNKNCSDVTLTVVYDLPCPTCTTSLRLNDGIFPIIGYNDREDYSTHIAVCHNKNCSLKTLIEAPDPSDMVYLSLDSNGHPVMIYHRFINQKTGIFRCMVTHSPTQTSTHSPSLYPVSRRTSFPSNQPSVQSIPTSSPSKSPTFLTTTSQSLLPTRTSDYLSTMVKETPNPSKKILYNPTNQEKEHTRVNTLSTILLCFGSSLTTVACFLGCLCLRKKFKKNKSIEKVSSTSHYERNEQQKHKFIDQPKSSPDNGSIEFTKRDIPSQKVIKTMNNEDRGFEDDLPLINIASQKMLKKEQGEGKTSYKASSNLSDVKNLQKWLTNLKLDSYYTQIENIGFFENNLNLFLESSLSEIDDLCDQVSMKLGEKNKLKIAFKEAKDVL